MKTLILALAMIVGGTAMAQQQPERQRKSADERALEHAQRMQTKLGLNDEQTLKVQAINLGISKKHEAIRSNTSISKDEKMTQWKETRDSRNAQYKEVLSAEQYAKYEAFEKEKHEKMKEKHERMKEKHGEKRGFDGKKGKNCKAEGCKKDK